MKKIGKFTSRASPFEAPNVELPVTRQVISGNFTFGAFYEEAVDVKLPVFMAFQVQNMKLPVITTLQTLISTRNCHKNW